MGGCVQVQAAHLDTPLHGGRRHLLTDGPLALELRLGCLELLETRRSSLLLRLERLVPDLVLARAGARELLGQELRLVRDALGRKGGERQRPKVQALRMGRRSAEAAAVSLLDSDAPSFSIAATAPSTLRVASSAAQHGTRLS